MGNTTEQGTIVDSSVTIMSQIADVIASNPNIWIPVIAAWAIGALFTKYLNGKQTKRKTDREFRVYGVCGSVAFFLYIGFNIGDGFAVCLPQATLAGAVSILLPMAWFFWQSKRGGAV